jgi:hypothetical protein
MKLNNVISVVEENKKKYLVCRDVGSSSARFTDFCKLQCILKLVSFLNVLVAIIYYIFVISSFTFFYRNYGNQKIVNLLIKHSPQLFPQLQATLVLASASNCIETRKRYFKMLLGLHYEIFKLDQYFQIGSIISQKQV